MAAPNRGGTRASGPEPLQKKVPNKGTNPPAVALVWEELFLAV